MQESDEDSAPSVETSQKHRGKNQPVEISSKKPVSTFRNVFNVKKNPRPHIDPRFNPAMGEYKPELFRKNYSFLNDMRKNELKELTEKLRSDPEMSEDKRKLLKGAILKLKQQIKSFEEGEKKEEIKSNFKAQAREDAKEGRKPQFLSKSDMRIVELAEKYKELKKSGKVEKFLAKKRKKQLSKDKQHLDKHLHFE